MKSFIKKFNETSINDVSEVGGKNASLGEMLSRLSCEGINVPDGFATTAFAFWTFLDHNNLRNKLKQILETLDHTNYVNLKETGEKCRALILNASMPDTIASDIIAAYKHLC